MIHALPHIAAPSGSIHNLVGNDLHIKIHIVFTQVQPTWSRPASGTSEHGAPVVLPCRTRLGFGSCSMFSDPVPSRVLL